MENEEEPITDKEYDDRPSIINQQIIANYPITDLRESDVNPNQGDFGAIHESIRVNGFYGTIIAQKSTGRILAGNHRFRVMKQSGATHIPVCLVDVDDEEATRIMIADNRTSRLGYDDPNILAAILADLARTEDELAGTGYDTDDLEELLRQLNAGPSSTPEPKIETKHSVILYLTDNQLERYRNITTVAKSESGIDDVAELLIDTLERTYA